MGLRIESSRGADARAVRGRTLCLLIADRPAPAALSEVTGAGALVETSLRPPLASSVSLRHPQAGTIEAEVLAHEQGGVRVRFARDERAVAFALGTIAGAMTATAIP